MADGQGWIEAAREHAERSAQLQRRNARAHNEVHVARRILRDRVEVLSNRFVFETLAAHIADDAHDAIAVQDTADRIGGGPEVAGPGLGDDDDMGSTWAVGQ